MVSACMLYSLPRHDSIFIASLYSTLTHCSLILIWICEMHHSHNNAIFKAPSIERHQGTEKRKGRCFFRLEIRWYQVLQFYSRTDKLQISISLFFVFCFFGELRTEQNRKSKQTTKRLILEVIGNFISSQKVS